MVTGRHFKRCPCLDTIFLVIIHSEVSFQKTNRTRNTVFFSCMRCPSTDFRKVHHSLVYLCIGPATQFAFSGHSDKKAVHKTCNHTTADCRKIIVFVAALSTFLCYNFCFYPFNFGCCCHRASPFIFFQLQAALLCKIELYKISGSSQAPTSRAEAWQSCCN